MGTEAAWVPLVISAIGAGASAYNSHQVAKEQDNVAAQGIRQQSARQKEADEKVSQEVDAIKQSNPEDARRDATDAFLGQLRRTRTNAVAGGPAGASDRYSADLSGAKTDVQGYGAQVADTMARINAPSLQRQAEGQSFSRLAGDLGGIARNANGDAFLNQMRLRGIRGNPWVEAGAGIASGVGSGMASSGYGYGSETGTTAPKRLKVSGSAGGFNG